MRRQTSSPSIPGMFTSSRIMSGPLWASAIASLPLAALNTRYPRLWKNRQSIFAISASSSAIRTLYSTPVTSGVNIILNSLLFFNFFAQSRDLAAYIGFKAKGAAQKTRQTRQIRFSASKSKALFPVFPDFGAVANGGLLSVSDDGSFD